MFGDIQEVLNISEASNPKLNQWSGSQTWTKLTFQPFETYQDFNVSWYQHRVPNLLPFLELIETINKHQQDLASLYSVWESVVKSLNLTWLSISLRTPI